MVVLGMVFTAMPVGMTQETQTEETTLAVDWDFWREKVDPETGEGVKSSGFAFTDTMRDVIWVKNTGTEPITKIKIKYLTVTEGHKVGNIPNWLTKHIPSECPRTRSYDVDLKPGEEMKFEETRPFTEWVTEDLAYQGMHTIKKWDPENVTVTGDVKKVVTLKDTEIDFSKANLRTKAVLYVNGQSFGKKIIEFKVVPP